MGWITLSLRKQTLKAQINEANYQDIQYSRQLRSVSRHLNYEKSLLQLDKKSDLEAAKIESGYEYYKNHKASYGSAAYSQWKDEYDAAKMEYEEAKNAIEDDFDEQMTEIEEEANNEETWIQEQQTALETQRDAMAAELQALTDEIKQEIEDSAIKF